MQYFVVIKGPMDVAEAAAEKYKVNLTVEAESRNGNEVYGYVPAADRDRLIDWYSRDAGYGGTFEPGSLLWYAERK